MDMRQKRKMRAENSSNKEEKLTQSNINCEE